ncbi:MAG: adenosine kinase [Acidimicrobiia bacterium]
MTFKFVGVGNAIVDILCNVDDNFIDKNNLNKSHMTLCSKEEQAKLLSQITEYWTLPGGSVANTISTLAKLNNDCGFAGLVSNDLWGDQFKTALEQFGIDLLAEPSNADLPTGTSVILITPDGERTMNTNLGISEYLNEAKLHTDKVVNSNWLIIEGYLFDKEKSLDTLLNLVSIAKDKKINIALSLSDKFCVVRNKDVFNSLFKDIDLLFSNESEFKEQFDLDIENLEKFEFSKLSNKLPSTTVITRSDKKCIAIHNSSTYFVDTKQPTVLADLTGAGDQFAAGFLYGFDSGWDIVKSLEFGVDLATKVISIIGPQLPKEELISLLKQHI